MKKHFILALVIVFGLAALVFGSFGLFAKLYETGQAPLSYKQTEIVFKNTVVRADVSDTNALRVRGLSGRANLPDGSGMWFAYEKEGDHSIWMKEMNFPLDILWFDRNFRLVAVKENAIPESFPEAFVSATPSLFVLEVSAGFVQKYQVAAGDTVTVHNPY